MKLVATNLIANDHLLEGCQLLCLIGKAMDACKLVLLFPLLILLMSCVLIPRWFDILTPIPVLSRYMQNFSHFNEAMWLAKVSLKEEEYSEVKKLSYSYVVPKTPWGRCLDPQAPWAPLF